ncbi:ParA family protein [Anaerosinus massiliensis]|uniref:ParA family protein n=1 Tax=Massilibacillus massiliensis TaxID=1806837 RepID=UPI000DA5EE4F|nr:ParA family protein [Massilibacillus massiliensis]
MKIVSIANLKGGVGKSTTAINMAYVLAEKGKKVLIADNDIQSNVSAFFDHKEIQPNITDVFMSGGDIATLRAAIKETKYKNLSILPSTMDLAEANIELAKNSEVEILRDCLRSLENDFDYIIIDNAPNMTPNVINAIIASDHIIVPTEIDCFGLDGLDKIKEQVRIAKASELNDNIEIVGVLITKYNGRTKMDREGAQHLRQDKQNKLFESMIHLTVKVKESTFQQIPIVRYAKRNRAAVDYIAFVDEYLEREGK